MVKARGDSLTGDLLSWEPPKVAAGFEEGAVRGSRISHQIAQVVKLALQGHDRATVAERMSEELGYPVSLNMIEKYASEAAEANKITLERFIALKVAPTAITGVVVPAKYAAIVEVHLIEEHEQEIARHKQAALAKVKGWR